jgi:hypothetical protein
MEFTFVELTLNMRIRIRNLINCLKLHRWNSKSSEPIGDLRILQLYQNPRKFQYSLGMGKKSGAVRTNTYLPTVYPRGGLVILLLQLQYLKIN